MTGEQCNASLPLLQTSSLDDVIDLVNQKSAGSTRALYIFGDGKAAKYLAQFIRTEVSFVNHIPASILSKYLLRLLIGHMSAYDHIVGPAAPSLYYVSPTARFRREMLETPSAQYSQTEGLTVEEVMRENFHTTGILLEHAARPLKSSGQALEGDMNFFLQAYRVSFGVFIYLPAAMIGAFGLVHGYRCALDLFK
jgi:aldehyde dehydrogenase (NAD+)